jgi:hypothetical protein
MSLPCLSQRGRINCETNSNHRAEEGKSTPATALMPYRVLAGFLEAVVLFCRTHFSELNWQML